MRRALSRALLRAGAALALALSVGACARDEAGAGLQFERPETALDYEVELTGAPTEEIDALMRASLELFRRQEDGAPSRAFLRRRALDDAPTAQRILRSFGYFESAAEIEVEELPSEGDGPPRALARFALAPGRPYILASHGFQVLEDGGTPPAPLDAAALGSPVGDVARAGPILDAEGAAVAKLLATGRPYARLLGRDALADPEAATVEVETAISSGAPFVFGDPVFEGLEAVEAEYLETYARWTPGAPWDQRRVRDYQRALNDTNLFGFVSVAAPETPPEGPAAPVVVRVEEAPFRTVTAGARWSTDLGPSVRGSFTHRNLFGSNETLRLQADAGRDEQALEARYRVPQYLRDQQDFVSGLNLRHTDDDAFEEYAGTLTAGLERRVSRWWVIGAGGLAEVSSVDDGEGFRDFFLLGLPVSATYENTDDLLNPTEGARLRVETIPFIGIEDNGDTPLFTRINAVGSAYLALDDERRYVFAARGRIGSIINDEVDDVPANWRLFSGGGGSVRGYAERSIGPLDADGDPIGGLSALEAGAELRARVAGDFGLAVFAEAGLVGEDAWPTFEEDVQYAAGGGLRYFSPIGPVRVDVGVPLNPRDSDDDFQIYLSIGQAF